MKASYPWDPEAMMASWTELQKAWVEQLEGTTPFIDALVQGQRLMTESFKAWPESADKSVFAGQPFVSQFLKQANEAWQDMVPVLTGDWQPVVKAYSQTLQSQLLSMMTSSMQSQADAGELWNHYLKTLKDLTANLPAMGETKALWSVYDKTLSQVLNSPSMGYSRELNQKVLKGFDAWLKLRQAESEYQGLMASIWAKAFESVMKALSEQALQGKPPQSAKAFLRLCISKGDEVFVKEFASQTYIETQGAFLNASMAYQVRERAIKDVVFAHYGLPTKSELDQAYKAIYELRRELRDVKGVKAELATLKAEADQGLSQEIQSLKQSLKELQMAKPPSLEDNLPLENYSGLAVKAIKEKLPDLSSYELEQLRAFELLHKNRKTLMLAFDRLREVGNG